MEDVRRGVRREDEGNERRRKEEEETNDVKFPVLSVGGTRGKGVVNESSRTLKSPALFRRKNG